MTYLNDITGMVALVLMLLVARGFGPHARIFGHDPVNLLQQGIGLASMVMAARLGYHDVLRPTLVMWGLIDAPAVSLTSQLLNAFFNSLLAFAAHRILVGLHASLPDDERQNYSWLTAPFYPKRINIFRKA